MRVALALAVLCLAGCAARPGTPVVVATADGGQRYEGERARSGRADSVMLTSGEGIDCGAELQPTKEVATGSAAAYGGVRCGDGSIGMLLLSGGPEAAGGAVSGVMERRAVSGRWGAGA